jgi:hypothetical protein
MAAGKLNILIEQGATFSKVLTVKADDNTPINLTGKTLRGQVRYNINDSSPALTFTFTLANQSTNPGVATWLASATDTGALTQSRGIYDVELVDGTSVTRILEGTAFISLNVTRA